MQENKKTFLVVCLCYSCLDMQKIRVWFKGREVKAGKSEKLSIHLFLTFLEAPGDNWQQVRIIALKAQVAGAEQDGECCDVHHDENWMLNF